MKRRDPTIYDKSTKFFDENSADGGGDDADGSAPKKKEKKLTIKQYEQDLLLKNGGAFDEESDNETNKRAQSPTYNEEQNMIKNEILGKVKNIDESEDEDDIGGLFSKREKTKKEEVKMKFKRKHHKKCVLNEIGRSTLKFLFLFTGR